MESNNNGRAELVQDDKNIQTHFYELYTQYGTLYFYEHHNNDTQGFSYQYGKIYEFFTGKEVVYTYDSITFVEDDVEFKTRHRFQGIETEWYYKEITPYEFLLRVAPYLDNGFSEKKELVNYALEMKKKSKPNHRRVVDHGQISEEFKNNASLKLLKPYMK